MVKKTILAAAFLISTSATAQKFEGLAQTPPMGWNSWNTFATDINAELIKGIADHMVESGMKDAGYTYIVLDDGWMAMERDSVTGDLIPHPEKFPNGMKEVVDYVHSKGLKFGLYNCAGTKTCAGYPGSRGYEYQDARLYAKLGVDYLKYDWCNTDGQNAPASYRTMSAALKKAGRPVTFSICEWGDNEPWEWAQPIGHLWRTTGDIYPCFDCEYDHGTWSSWGVLKIIDMRNNDTLRRAAGPGHWNDPDMMEVGNGMTAGEDRVHFSMWAMLAAPLIAGNDLRNMSKQTVEILTNKDVIAVDQDPLGIQGFKYKKLDSVDVWVRPLENDEWAVAFLNRGREDQKINFDWENEKIVDDFADRTLDAHKTLYTLYNLWTKKNDGKTNKMLKTTVPGHDIVMYRLRKS